MTVKSGFLVLWRQRYMPAIGRQQRADAIHARQHAEAAEACRKRQQQRLRDPAAVTAGKIFI